jgi:signal peptidase
MTESDAGTPAGTGGTCDCQTPCALSLVGGSALNCRAAPPIMLPTAEPPEEAAPPPTRRWRRAWRWVTGALAIAFMLGAIVLAWPQDRGGQFRLVVVSGTSMEPTYHTADMLIARKSGDYQVGDVVVYTAHIEGTPVGRVVHRLVEVQPDGTYLTQGDNKDYRDPWSVRPEWIEGRVIAVIPQGFVIIYILRNPIFLAVMSGLLMTAAFWPRKSPSEPPAGPAVSDLPPPTESGTTDVGTTGDQTDSGTTGEPTDSGTTGTPPPADSAWQP